MARTKATTKRALARINPGLARAAVQSNRYLQRRLRQWRPRRVDESGYYPQQPDCQIRTLSHLYSQFLGNREHGTFVEIGANDGVLVSNTWGLAERKWRGVMVEPVPALAAACRRNHRRHPKVVVIETAIGDGSQSEITLSVAGAYTTANPDQRREYEGIEWSSRELTGKDIVVPSQTLDDLLTTVGLSPGFDVLVVDVEGFEAAVFAGFTLPAWRPKMMIIELADTHPRFTATRDDDAALGQELSAGYKVVYKDAINTVFVGDDVWKSAFANLHTPPDVAHHSG